MRNTRISFFTNNLPKLVCIILNKGNGLSFYIITMNVFFTRLTLIQQIFVKKWSVYSVMYMIMRYETFFIVSFDGEMLNNGSSPSEWSDVDSSLSWLDRVLITCEGKAFSIGCGSTSPGRRCLFLMFIKIQLGHTCKFHEFFAIGRELIVYAVVSISIPQWNQNATYINI